MKGSIARHMEGQAQWGFFKPDHDGVAALVYTPKERIHICRDYFAVTWCNIRFIQSCIPSTRDVGRKRLLSNVHAVKESCRDSASHANLCAKGMHADDAAIVKENAFNLEQEVEDVQRQWEKVQDEATSAVNHDFGPHSDKLLYALEWDRIPLKRRKFSRL